MNAFTAFSACLGSCGAQRDGQEVTPRWLQQQNIGAQAALHEKQYSSLYSDEDPSDDDVPATADRVVKVLLTAASQADVDAQLADVRARAHAFKSMTTGPVATASWTESLATAVLQRLVPAVQAALEDGSARLGDATGEIVAWARAAAPGIFQWAEDHPRLVALLAFVAAVAVTYVLLPWVLEAVGFGELGPIAGSIAARLQVRYLGAVPKGSWFSFFQRLGMIWKH